MASIPWRTFKLKEGMNIQNIPIALYDTNLYSSGHHNITEKTLKTRLRGLPLSVDNSAVLELLEKLKVKLKRKIIYEKIRHPVTNKMTSVLNGNRFMYIEPLSDGKHLPSAGLKWQIFHYGQPKYQRKFTCTRCWANDHIRRYCKTRKVYKQEGHNPGHQSCPSYEAQGNVIAFN